MTGDGFVVGDSFFIVAPIVCVFMFSPCFDIEYVVSFKFCNHLAGEERERGREKDRERVHFPDYLEVATAVIVFVWSW